MKKVIVIGLDGFEPKIAERMIEAGELPNLAKLRQKGSYARLRTTYPAQTPVAWSTFMTGTNPGGHGIFDFLGRDPSTYLPLLALTRYEQKNPFVLPRVVNMRRGRPLWNLLTEKNIPSTVIRCVCTYPPDEVKGHMLSGVGVPDLRGGLGTATFYTSNPSVRASNSEKVVQLKKESNTIVTHLIGPRNPKTREDFKTEIRLEIDASARKVSLRSDGHPERLEIQEGKWSKWLKVAFKTGMFQSVHGAVRFYLKQIEPDFEFYAGPVNFDAEAPLFPISYPANYASELETRLGTYYTLGMAEDHDGLINGRFDESAYLEQCAAVMKEREQMMLFELERFKEGLFFCLYDTPDRLTHLFWRFHEPEHPANQQGTPAGMERVIAEHYRDCDRIVGEAMAYADDHTLFITLSDHGMNSFQRGLNLNTWLYENGFLTLKSGFNPGEEENGDFFRNVDWDRTQAYALGLGGIYLNLKGRETNGILSAEQAERTKDGIINKLSDIIDPARKVKAVTSVVRREQIYTGPYTSEAPDLLVNFTEGYRVSWGTPLGGIPAGLFEDNVKKWGGDHVIDPAFVPGVLFMSQPFDKKEPSLVDLAPTILAALNAPKNQAMEGNNLLS